MGIQEPFNKNDIIFNKREKTTVDHKHVIARMISLSSHNIIQLLPLYEVNIESYQPEVGYFPLEKITFIGLTTWCSLHMKAKGSCL